MDQLIPIQPDSPVSLFRLFPASIAQVDSLSDGLIEAVRNGEVNPLELLASLKATAMAIERVIKETRENQLKEADKYPGTSFEAFGCKIEKAEVGTSYDYASCGDPIWEQRAKILAEAKLQLTERETFLKAIKSPMGIVTEDGEAVAITPPLKKSTSGLKVSVK